MWGARGEFPLPVNIVFHAYGGFQKLPTVCPYVAGSPVIIYQDDSHVMALTGRCVKVPHRDRDVHKLGFIQNPVWEPVQTIK